MGASGGKPRRSGTAVRRADLWIALALACASLALPAFALGANPAFPGDNPAESPRANTPDDAHFDECEGDDADGAQECSSYFSERFHQFGFSPDSAHLGVPEIARPFYADCNPLTPQGDGQLDTQGENANRAAEAGGLPGLLEPCYMLGGVRADTAWKYFGQANDRGLPGDPEVTIAILDTGARWQDAELRNKVALNGDELPVPLHDRAAPVAGGGDCATFADDDDADGSGAFDVLDYRCDSRVALAAGDEESDGVLDPSDLIATFSDGGDDDGNGYADDIAGWDFFDDDNDPFDASSCCSADGHGTGRAKEAAAETNNGTSSGPNSETGNAGADAGMCPDCQIMPVRIWDSFVAPIDLFAMGVVYAASNGAEVVEGAVGGLGNTRFARKAFEFADERGVALTMVSSDINSANHNYPTNYNEAIYVGGAMPDTAPNDTCAGPGGLPGFEVVPLPEIPGEFAEGCQALLALLDDLLGISITAQPPTTSFFRNSNVTQYGGKADIVLMGATGSENTGQAAGAAGLIASYGRLVFGEIDPLTGNEIRQLLTMTAEDVRPGNALNHNLGLIGAPFVDKAAAGWDPHFGYGRVNLAGAMARIAADNVPPEVQIDSPDWFSPINVDRVSGGIPVRAHIAAPHSAGVGAWRLDYACGQDAPDSAFTPVPGASGTGAVDGVIGTLPQSLLESLAANCNGEVSTDAGRPAGGLGGGWPADPYPDPDPERHAFQIRLTASEQGNPANFGRYRKTLFAYSDDGNLPGWPRPIGTGSDPASHVTGSGGEVSPRLYDVDGDNRLDVIQATTSGEVHVLNADGSPVASFNGGNPATTERYQLEQSHPVPAGLPPPRETPRVPAIGDVDGDLVAEIVLNAGEHIYAWELNGDPVPGFQGGPGDAALDRSLSEPCLGGVAAKPCFDVAQRRITSENHIKRGFFGSVALADLDCDNTLDVVAGGMDQHVYAWRGNGNVLPGFPRRLASDGADGAEIITTPAIAELDGRGCEAEGPERKGPEVVIATNEVIGAEPAFPDDLRKLLSLFNVILENATGSNPVYAVHGDGSDVAGWPVKVGVAAGDLLPMVLPGHDAAVLDVDGDGRDEVSVSAATSVQPGGARLVEGNGGESGIAYLNAVANSPDQGPIVNVADYQSVGDLTGLDRPAIVKGGVTVNFAANLLASNQNLPFSHVEQAWDAASALPIPGFPAPTDDFQLLSQASVARVGGPGPGRQVLVGTGLYNLHAYGVGGAEPAGWPKFTGGWQQATPAVGDADGDGDLDVTTVTREGWSFLWDTGVDACAGSNDEWWTFHHDERSTNDYGGDGRPPARPTDLEIQRGADGGAEISFEAPGDDWSCGRADVFRVIVSPELIEEPTDGTVAADLEATVDAGQTESAALTAEQIAGNRHLAVLHRDEAGNWGLLLSAPIPGTGGDGGGPGGGGTGGGPGGDAPGAGGDAGTGEACANERAGGRGRDRLEGTDAGDLLRGLRGRDRLLGRGGDDCLFGNKGGDRLHGGDGDDRLSGGNARDRLNGGAGADRIKAGAGRDKVRARDGEADVVRCGKGRDFAAVDRADRVKGCERVRRR